MSIYDIAHKHAVDKTVYINDVKDRILNVMLSAFQYDGLPDTIPQQYLEKQILVNGHVGVFKNKGKIYALTGQTDTNGIYGESLTYQIDNQPLNLNSTFTIGKNISIVRNDVNAIGIMPTVFKYASLMCDADITLDTADILSRIMLLITAPDDRSKQAADMFVRRINDGDFTVIGDNAFFDGVKVQQASSGNSAIGTIIQLMQYYKASMYNDLGLQANWNTKKESLNSSEVGMNDDVLLPYVDNMLATRQHDIALVNSMFDLNITVQLSSAWAKNHGDDDSKEDNEKQNTVTATDTTDSDSPTVSESSVQGSGNGSTDSGNNEDGSQSDDDSKPTNPTQPTTGQSANPDTSTTEETETVSTQSQPIATEQALTDNKTVAPKADSVKKPETSKPVKEEDRIRVKKDVKKEKESAKGNNK